MKLNLFGHHAEQLQRMMLAGRYESLNGAMRAFIELHGDDFINRFDSGHRPSNVPQPTVSIPPETKITVTASATADRIQPNQPPTFL
jgi:hypothetical protein